MIEIGEMSFRRFKSYPLMKKHFFRWLRGLSQEQAKALVPDFWIHQAHFIKCARLWRELEIEDVKGISACVLLEIEDQIRPVNSDEWALLIKFLRIERDVTFLFCFLEEALNPTLRKSRDDMSKNLVRIGLSYMDPLLGLGVRVTSVHTSQVLKFPEKQFFE